MSRLLIIAGLAAIVTHAAICEEPTAKEHPDIVAAKDKYLRELRSAVGPIQKRYLTRLESLQRDLTRRGNLDGALAAKAAIESIEKELTSYPVTSFAGVWALKYSNGVTRTYIISRDGTVRFVEKNMTGRLVQNGRDILLNFGDGKLERLSFRLVLDIQHYGTQKALAERRPSDTATGTRRKQQPDREHETDD